MKEKYYTLIFIGIILFVMSLIAIKRQNEEEKILSKGVLVIGTVKNFVVQRGVFIVSVVYPFKGKTINNTFGIYNIDSLERNGKVRLLISTQNPTQYIKYIGVEK